MPVRKWVFQRMSEYFEPGHVRGQKLTPFILKLDLALLFVDLVHKFLNTSNDGKS